MLPLGPEDEPTALRETRILRGLRRVFSTARRRQEAERTAGSLVAGYAVWGTSPRRRHPVGDLAELRRAVQLLDGVMTEE